MKIYGNIFLALCLMAPVAGKADIKSSSPEGYLSRGVAMYNDKNYVGAIDQLTQLQMMPIDAKMAECAEFYIALCRYERNESQSIIALQQYILSHPSSPNVDLAWATIGNHLFFAGKYGEAVRHYDKVRIEALDADTQEDIYYRRAYSLLRLGEYEQARVDISMLQGTKRYGNAYTFYQAYLDYAAERYDAALQKFNRVNRAGELGYNAQYYICQIYFTQGDFEKTSTLAKSLLADGNNPAFKNELNRLIGECAYQTGDDEQAEKYLKTYIDASEGEPIRSAAYAYGVVQYRNGNYDEAIANFSKATAENDELAQSAYQYMGNCYVQLHQLNRASMAFEKAVQLDFNREVTETAFYNYAVSQNEGGRTPFNKSIDMFERFINTYPNSRYTEKVEEYLINAYVTTTDYQRALQSINNIKRPSQKVLGAKQYVLYQLGVQALSNNDVKGAKSMLTQSLNLETHDKNIAADTRLWLGECAYRLGDYASAQKYQSAFLKTAAASNANRSLGYYNLGYSLFQQKKYADARSNFENAAQNGNLSASLKADAYNRAGDCLYYTKQYAAAESCYDKAYKTDASTAGDYALYQKAIMQGLGKNYSAKIEAINSLIKQYPSSAWAASALLEKANTYVLLNDNKSAEAAYLQLLDEYPATAEARKGLLQLAINEHNMGNETKAITTYKQVISKYPTSEEAAVAADDLKLIYADKGNLNEYADFLSNVPNAPQLNAKEVERLTFAAAEKAALAETPDLAKMQKYMADYPDGAFAPNACYYMGRDSYQNKDYDKALTLINKALEATDASFAEDALAIKSEILMKQGHNAEAIDTYRLLESKSSSRDNKIIANLGIMRASKEMSHWDDVLSSAATLLSLGSLTANEERETILNRAIAYTHLGKKAEAKADYATLAKDVRNEVGAQAAYLHAKMLYDEGKTADCEKHLNAFIDEGTPHQYWLAKAFILLADVYHKKGDSFEACEYLRSLKSNYPGTESDIFTDIDTRLKAWQK
ncbi:MAG: tetratricopeptide repeat protein [bacterium]|nr:tetratricopeptide repeat protein [bacterium]